MKGADELSKCEGVSPPKLEVRGDTVCVNTVGGRHAPQAGGPWRIVTHGALCRDHKRARGCGATARAACGETEHRYGGGCVHAAWQTGRGGETHSGKASEGSFRQGRQGVCQHEPHEQRACAGRGRWQQVVRTCLQRGRGDGVCSSTSKQSR